MLTLWVSVAIFVKTIAEGIIRRKSLPAAKGSGDNDKGLETITLQLTNTTIIQTMMYKND